MIIESIFDNRLYSFKYEEEEDNEYGRLFEEWNDTEYLRGFIKTHLSDLAADTDINGLAEYIIEEAEDMENDLMDENANLNQIFSPLYNQEYKDKILSRRKGKDQSRKRRKKYLRIYAIKIDDNCFVITGGAIKFTHLMEDRTHTQNELDKINRCKDYLKDNDVFDDGSFYEFLNEN